VFASRFSSCIRKSSRRPTAPPAPTTRRTSSTWVASLLSSSSTSARSPYSVTSWRIRSATSSRVSAAAAASGAPSAWFSRSVSLRSTAARSSGRRRRSRSMIEAMPSQRAAQAVGDRRARGAAFLQAVERLVQRRQHCAAQRFGVERAASPGHRARPARRPPTAAPACGSACRPGRRGAAGRRAPPGSGGSTRRRRRAATLTGTRPCHGPAGRRCARGMCGSKARRSSAAFSVRSRKRELTERISTAAWPRGGEGGAGKAGHAEERAWRWADSEFR